VPVHPYIAYRIGADKQTSAIATGLRQQARR